MKTTRKSALTKRVESLEEYNDCLNDDWHDLVADVARLARAVRTTQDKLEAIEVRRPTRNKSSGRRLASCWHRFIAFMGSA